MRKAVVVIGAGVSGCACAATLSSCHVSVTLMNSALDAVGRPSHGPLVEAGEEGWGRIIETLASLPAPLRSAWLEASSTCDSQAPFFFVDRRMLSIETKRALEQMPGLEFRQGLVNALRYMPQAATAGEAGTEGTRDGRCRTLVIETAFGESIEADAVVLAVGMSLGGHVRVGDDVLSGGRYGETPAEGLRTTLEALGAVFEERSVEVGPCFPKGSLARMADVDEVTEVTDRVLGWGRRFRGRHMRVAPLRERLETVGGVSLTVATPVYGWPAGYPPASHWDAGLQPDAVLVDGCREDAVRRWLYPEGKALGEMHLPAAVPGSGRRQNGAGGDEKGRGGGSPGDEDEMDVPIASRLGHVVTGLVVTNVDRAGRLMADGRPALPVWICGRAGGATDYLGSLASGVRTGREVAQVAADLAGLQ